MLMLMLKRDQAKVICDAPTGCGERCAKRRKVLCRGTEGYWIALARREKEEKLQVIVSSRNQHDVCTVQYCTYICTAFDTYGPYGVLYTSVHSE